MKDLAYYMSLPYEIKVKKLSKEEGGGFGAQMPIFEPFALFFGQGKSEAEAIEDLWQAFAAHVEDALKHGDFIPEPTKPLSKNYAITMKTNIMEQIDKEASRLGISRSALIAVGMQDYIKRNSI